MTAIDDISTIFDSSYDNTVKELEERIAFLSGKMEAQQAIYLEQVKELQSTISEVHKENLTLKAKNDELFREKEKLKEDICGLKQTVDKLRRTIQEESQNRPLSIYWKSSASTVSTGGGFISLPLIDTLNAPLPCDGVHKWKIKILRENGIRLGVVLEDEQNYDTSLGATGKSWGYGGWGDAWHNNCKVGGHHVGFGTGAVVTLILDLTTEDGSLLVGVDDKPMIQVFKSMNLGNKKFFPGVYLWNDSCVEFLGYDS